MYKGRQYEQSQRNSSETWKETSPVPKGPQRSRFQNYKERSTSCLNRNKLKQLSNLISKNN